MTDRDIVERVAVYFNRRLQQNKPSKLGGRPQFRVSIQGARAIELMTVLRPHMGRRRQEQIDNVLAFEANRPDGNKARREWSANEAASRQRDERGRLLNRTGRI